MPGATHIIGYRDVESLRLGAASFQQLGYTTVQLGPSSDVLVRPANATGNHDWPVEEGKLWFVLVATNDPITIPGRAPEE